MSRRSDYMPPTEAAFNEWQTPVLPYIEKHAGRFDISLSGDFVELKDLQGRYLSKFAAANNPATRTKAAVSSKNDALKAFKTAFRRLIKEKITYNSHVTDEDRINMGLPVHKTTRTRSTTPPTTPSAEVHTPHPGIVTLNIYDGVGKHVRKPNGVRACEVRWALSDGASINDWNMLLNSAYTTATRLSLSFNSTDRGRNLSFALRWEGTRGQKGTWSNIKHTIVP